MPTILEFPLAGGGGEPVDLRRTLNSHGFVDLPPMRLRPDGSSLDITLVAGRAIRTVRVGPGGGGRGRITILGPAVGASTGKRLLASVRHVLRLDEDLSRFYDLAAADPDLSWVALGAGRMIQAPTVFEDVVKTICTTNCSWSGTTRMVTALVEHLGAPATGAPAGEAADGAYGRAFPGPEAMADAGPDFYRQVARAGYRGAYLIGLARAVAEGELDLEGLRDPALPDEEVERRLLDLPGVGPYAAAHIMMTIGRYHRLILDSWTRPTYAKLVGRRVVKDAVMERRFRRFGPYAGLAFWLYLTRDWVS
ncbi:MAG TPA: Fe-S cluster assembly protein HesB [Actinomycetota bacterium]|jgi:N-glycosylase/DNA lyase|nr:Fe-S cluster assembly protein HesB [Actinomycetota bacterium]